MLPKSPEFPQFLWGGPPRAFGRGRDGKSVMYGVVHYTAGSEGRSSAESGAVYDKARSDGTSCHAFADADSVVQEVLTSDRANSAFHKGNRLGVQLEICGTLQTRAQWLDPVSDATLWMAARWQAAVCRKYGLPVRLLSVAEVRAAWYQYPHGPRGICGHVDVTRAYPEDGGTHTDPGPGFPWDIFLARVRQLVDEATRPREDDDMKLMLAQVTGDTTVLVGDGVTSRPVRSPDAVRDLLAAGADGRWLSTFYVATGTPLPSMAALEDRLGGPVDEQSRADAG